MTRGACRAHRPSTRPELGTVAIRLLVDHVVERTDTSPVHRLCFVIDVFDRRAISVDGRVVVRSEGVLRHALRRDGDRHDEIVMRIVRSAPR